MIYPPYGFLCQYKHSCPHLDWLSTTWVMEELRGADDTYHEHLEIIDRFKERLKDRDERVRLLEKENTELKAKLMLLHQKQFKANKKEKIAVSEKTTSSLTKKKRGAPLGHPGWGRTKPEHIDRTIHVPAPTTCPHCLKDNLASYDGMYEHVQEDIVIKPRTEVVRYLHGQSFVRHATVRSFKLARERY